MAASLVVRMATSISTNKATQARLERNPTVNKHPPTDSTPDTTQVIRRGNGTLASTSVSYIVCLPPATNNLFAPEMAKNSPSETRTSRMAYGSKSLLPCNANWTNRFQSTSCPSTIMLCSADSRAGSVCCVDRGFARPTAGIPAPRPRDRCGAPFQNPWHRTPPNADPVPHGFPDSALRNFTDAQSVS